MILTCRERKYNTKYKYNNNWTLQIGRTDGHSFLAAEEGTDNFISCSKDNYEDAEEVVYKNYLKAIDCKHDWFRLYEYANIGYCKHCNSKNLEQFETLSLCNHEDCNESGDFSITSKLPPFNSVKLCFKHYKNDLEMLKINLLEKNNENYENYEDFQYNNLILFTLEVLNILENTNYWKNLTKKEKTIFTKKLFSNLNRVLNQVFHNLKDKLEIVNLTNGHFFTFCSLVKYEDLSLFAKKYLIDVKIIPFEDLDFKKQEHDLKEAIKKR